MPWELSAQALLVVFVVLFVAGAGWTLGSWVITQIVSRIPPPK